MFEIRHIDEDVAIETLRQLEEDYGLIYKINLETTYKTVIYLEDNGVKIERRGRYSGVDKDKILKKLMMWFHLEKMSPHILNFYRQTLAQVVFKDFILLMLMAHCTILKQRAQTKLLKSQS